MRRLLVCCSLVFMLATPGVAQPTRTGVAVTGVVQDQTGGVLPGAAVDLVTDRGAVVTTTATDAVGTFQFGAVAAGAYDVRVTLDGFKQHTTRLRVGARPPSRITIVLGLSNLTSEVVVSNAGPGAAATASNNLDAVTIDQGSLDALPIFDQDVIGTLSQFLDASALGSGGPTVIVNGMEVSALRVSASAIQQVKINQDPYAAEFARPGRGRIEILTKPGGKTYEGEANLVFRDAQLDARNAFATSRPAGQKQTVEGIFGGPVGSSGRTSFMLSGNDAIDNHQATVFAIGPTGAIQDVVPQRSGNALLSFGLTHQWSDNTTISIRPAYQYELNQNQGVGGTSLASAGTTFTHHEEQITYTQQTTWRSTLLNQFQILIGHEREPTISASPDRRIVVAGAFTSGGQGDLLLTETHAQMTENLTWIHGSHQIQTGFQLPDWSRRGFFDHTNTNGAYYFSDLASYAAGRPYSYIQQAGNGNVTFLEKQIGTYLKDEWQVGPKLSASLGVRYDWQNYFHDDNNIAPRVSVAFTPHSRHNDVIRTGIGIFNDRSGAAAIADLLHSAPGGLVRYVISNPSYPDPFPGGSSTTPPPPGITRLASDVQIPQTLQASVSWDHQLGKTLTSSVSYTESHGYHQFRSRDVNAPLPPLYDARPDPAYGAIREIESDGRQVAHSLQAMMRGRIGRWFNGQTQYTWSHASNDTNGITSYPANDYDLSGEWGRANFDRRHRFLLLGVVSPRQLFDLGVNVTMQSGAPYTELLGADVYNNGRGLARPEGVARNTLQGAGSSQVDLRLSRSLKNLGRDGRSLTFVLDAFNILNRVNYDTYVGTLGSPLFLQPVSARAARQIQMSARVTF
ncbi:MAG: TonB-dependent receptor [Acidobacteriaceae bacterium]|jgi:hypothetical protein|nr:TonB-dependent receptor [Acidobacteriaceae bacterium]